MPITLTDLILLGIVAAVIAALAYGLKIIHQQTVGIIETFGKFSAAKQPGLTFVIPVIQHLVARVSTSVTQTSAVIEIKTRDNMFVKLPVKIMLQVMSERAADAHYQLAGSGNGDAAENQVASWVLNNLRSSASEMELEELFGDRDRLRTKVQQELAPKMAKYGFIIVDVLVDQPMVADSVQASFDRVVASQRELEAAKNDALTKREMLVGASKADAEAQKLRAQALAEARTILIDNLASTVKVAKEAGVDEAHVMNLLIETARFDTIRSASEHGGLVVMDARNPPALTLHEPRK